MKAAAQVTVAAVAVYVAGWLVLEAAVAGGWVRFGAALLIGTVALVVLPKEIRDARYDND
jgi:hypothetical protein